MSKIRVSAEVAPPTGFHAALLVSGWPQAFLLDRCQLSVSSQHVPAMFVCLGVQMSPFYKGTSHIGLGSTLMTSSKLGHLQRLYSLRRPQLQVVGVLDCTIFQWYTM